MYTGNGSIMKKTLVNVTSKNSRFVQEYNNYMVFSTSFGSCDQSHTLWCGKCSTGAVLRPNNVDYGKR